MLPRGGTFEQPFGAMPRLDGGFEQGFTEHQLQQFPRTQAELIALTGVTWTAAWRDLTATSGAGNGGFDIVGANHLTLSAATGFYVAGTPFAGKTTGGLLSFAAAGGVRRWLAATPMTLGFTTSILELGLYYLALPDTNKDLSGNGNGSNPGYRTTLGVSGGGFVGVYAFDGSVAVVATIAPHPFDRWVAVARGVDRSVQRSHVRTRYGYAEADVSAVGDLDVATRQYVIGTVGGQHATMQCVFHAVAVGAPAEGVDTAALLARFERGV